MSTAAPLQTLAAKTKPLSTSIHAGLLLQRKCACGSPTSSLTGECAECKSGKRLQTKLAIGASNDPLEEEADRVADQVMRMSAPEVSVAAAAQVSRKFAEYESHTEGTDTAPASVDRVLASSGKPLDPALRQDMEQRFGHDFSRVQVHSGAAAEQSARDVNAHAYTVGCNVVFGVGRFAPATPGGRRLLAHELTHVVQQSDGNRAVAAVVRRQTGAEGAYKIISQIWQVAGRDIVAVATGHGDQVLFFYRRIGTGSKGVGVAPKAGQWTPFKTLMTQDESILGAKANPNKAWINKQPYYTQVAPEDPLRGMANKRNQQVGAWLDKEGVPAGTVKDWQTVEQEMDNVAGKYRQSVKGGGGGGAKAATAEVKGGAVETKAAGVETKAVGVEAKALATEAKLVGVEVTALKAENVLTKGAQIAAKGAKIARISELVIALGMPGPWDVFFMFIAAFASLAEAKAKLRADAYALGFAEGLAAVITWTQADDVQRMLMNRVTNPSMGERVAGFEGVREKGNNEGGGGGVEVRERPERHAAQGLSGSCPRGDRAAGTPALQPRRSDHDGRRPQAHGPRSVRGGGAARAREAAGGGMATGEPAPAHVMR